MSSGGEPTKGVLQAREPAALPWLFNSGELGGDLPDINVWLALAITEHPHHTAAKRYWAKLHEAPADQRKLWFCRVTMLGLIRLLCQPKVVGPGALSLGKAFDLYQQFRTLKTVGLLPDPVDCEMTLQRQLKTKELPTRLWTDVYLASLAEASGVRLVTFDTDFQRFDLPKCLVLDKS